MEVSEKIYVPLIRMQAVKEKQLPYALGEMDEPQKIVRMVNGLLKNADKEYMLSIPMDIGNKPVAVEIVAVGALNQAVVETRELFKHAIVCNAASIVMVHNHPSGNPEPSKEDYAITTKMKKVGDLLGIPLLDHIIVGDGESYVSFREEVKEKW